MFYINLKYDQTCIFMQHIFKQRYLFLLLSKIGRNIIHMILLLK